jgi:membrane protein
MSIFNFVKSTFGEFGKDKGGQLSAAFAYTGVFALAPALIVVLSIAGIIYGQKAAEGQLFANFSDVVGPTTAASVQHAIAHTHQSTHSSLALIVGIVGSIVAASALAAQLQSSFDTIFDVVPEEGGGVKRFLYTKAKNVLLLIIGSAIVAMSIIATSLLAAAGAKLANHLDMPPGTLQVINILASFVVFVIFLYAVYRALPDIKLPRLVVLNAALLIGLLFLIGKLILGWVIGHNGTASAYGAAASLITLLLWFYYTGQILYLGAEGMKVYAADREIALSAKHYSAKQKTLSVKAKNDLKGKSVEKFARGFTKKVRDE